MSMRPSSYFLETDMISAVQPISATPSDDARTTPNGFFHSRHSAIISRYRGSKICSGKGTPGSSTRSSGKMGNSEFTAFPVQRFYATTEFSVLSSHFKKNPPLLFFTENRKGGTKNSPALTC